jgi:tungstate transport system substrate-binding protein
LAGALLITLIVSIGGGYYLLNPQKPNSTNLVVSTTTSLYDTGILDAIEEDFEANHPIDLYFISVGTGLAIAHAKRGDADIILVHAPAKEISFIEEGYGVNRKIIAYNFFSIIGPKEDPIEIQGLNPTEALTKLVENGREGNILWVSRGDDSGTHSKEKNLWSLIGVDISTIREENWYLEAGSGMGKTLLISNEYRAYTLTDMGTFLKYSKDGLVDLNVLVGAGEELINIYSAIAVNPEVHPSVEFDTAVEFIEYMISNDGQEIFGVYGNDDYGNPLFNPAVKILKTASNLEIRTWIESMGFYDGSECPIKYRKGENKLYD